MNLQKEIKEGAAKLGLNLTEDAYQRLFEYVTLLVKWNKVYNLTAIRDPEQMVSHHILDSLVVLPHLWPKKWLDVGCGAGLPGLVLAIARPEWEFTLVDSNSKKTSFVQQAVIELGLKNVKVLNARVEELAVADGFDGIISRAFAELADFIQLTRPLLASTGRWAAMKGVPENELERLPNDVVVERIIPLTVSGLEAARSLVIVKAN